MLLLGREHVDPPLDLVDLVPDSGFVAFGIGPVRGGQVPDLVGKCDLRLGCLTNGGRGLFALL